MARKSRKTLPTAAPTIDLAIRAALYIRLSVEDGKTGSISIETQKLILNRYLESKPEIFVYDTYIDNGATGTNYHRSGFQQILSDIEAGLVNCVIVKDLSRLGRNSIDTGYYIEQYFSTHILEDERYTGTYVIGKRAVIEVGGTKSRKKDKDKWYVIPDHHSAIVEKALFEKVQNTVLRYSLPNKKPHEYLLKGKVYCGCCDHALSRVAYKNSYFHCRHSDADESLRCHGMRIGTAELEQLIFEVLKKQLSAIGLDGSEDETVASTCSFGQYECEHQISDLQDSKMKLYERFLSRELSLEQFNAAKEGLDAALIKTKNAHAAISAQAKQAQEDHTEQVQRGNIIQEINAADGLNSAIVDMLIDKVYVHPDKRIEITYKVKDFFDAVV